MNQVIRLLLISTVLALLVAAISHRARADDATEPAAATKLREAYESEIERIRADAIRRMAQARDRTIQQLENVMQAETRRENLAGAAAIKTMIAELSAAPDSDKLVPSMTAKDESSDETDLDDASDTTAHKVTLQACGQDDIQIRMNGKEIMRAGRTKVTAIDVELRAGDIITVLSRGREDINSLWLAATDSEGKTIYFQTSRSWIAYLPPDRESWWDIRGKKFRSRRVDVATDDIEYVELVKSSIRRDLPDLHTGDPVFAPLSLDKYETYLAYIVRKRDLTDAPRIEAK